MRPTVVALSPDVCILSEASIEDRSEAVKALHARALTAALDPSCPHDAQLLSALERWSFGDHA